MTQTRIDRKFQELGGRKALIAYITAGDPSLQETEDLVLCLGSAGADIIELGIPFSDPLMDGPVIQQASLRSLRAGAKVSCILQTVARLRKKTQVPLLLMTCYNPIFRFGAGRFAEVASRSGVDGILITDLPPEEAPPWKEHAERCGLNTIFLLAPTSTRERIEETVRLSSGFVYCIAQTGVTGTREAMPAGLDSLIRSIRAHTAKPIAVGFGVSTPDHARAVARWADGVIVGSAIVKLIALHSGQERLDAVARFTAGLKAAVNEANENLPLGG
ncbi:MAG: tryptophan synthase subunit alpha [Armatimonadetes bacterium]|nr:tryptophan synthase subunit alpha [Armatimonadota bacterium]